MKTARTLLPPALALTFGLGPGLAAPATAGEKSQPLLVRASALLGPCVEAAARQDPGRLIRVDASAGLDAADLLVAADVEVNRALERGAGLADSDVEVARAPWVLRVAAGTPPGITGLEDALARGLEVVLPRDAAASYEARRRAGEHGGRLREAADPGELRSAPLALLPRFLADPGEQVQTNLRPLEVRAAVLSGSKRAEAARAFVSFLGSEPGRRAFASCGKDR